MCDGRANVLARIPGRTHTKAPLLNGHLDTVPHGGGWSSSAGAATQRDGKIYGRGASDMKSGLAALLYAFWDFARSGKAPRRDVLFAGICDEESGGLGACALAESGALNGVSSIVIGEPTELGMGLAAKGCLWLRLQVRGRTSHGAYPQRGINAIEGAFAFARALQADIAGQAEPSAAGANHRHADLYTGRRQGECGAGQRRGDAGYTHGARHRPCGAACPGTRTCPIPFGGYPRPVRRWQRRFPAVRSPFSGTRPRKSARPFSAMRPCLPATGAQGERQV